MIDFEETLAFAKTHCQLDDIETELTRAALNSRLEVAKRIFWDHPQFQPIVLLCCETEAQESTEAIGRGLLRETEELQEMALDNELLESADYLALLAGMTAFMDRLVEPRQNTARIVLTALETNPFTVESAESLALLAMACWFTDYHDFQRCLRTSLDESLSA